MSTYKRAPPQDKPAPNSLTSLTARDSLQAPGTSDDGEASLWNPVSRWQEEVEIPGLTLYDIHREPRRASVDPSARVRVQLQVCYFRLQFTFFVLWPSYVLTFYTLGSFPGVPLLCLSILHQKHKNRERLSPSLLQRLYRKMSKDRDERMPPVPHPYPQQALLTP
jgi:hypothetical protein